MDVVVRLILFLLGMAVVSPQFELPTWWANTSFELMLVTLTKWRVWVVCAISVSLAFRPHLLLVRGPIKIYAAEIILIVPFSFLGIAIVITAINMCMYPLIGLHYFGLMHGLDVVLCFAVSLLLANIFIDNDGALKPMLLFIALVPAISFFSFISGFSNELLEVGDRRFHGFGVNPNVIAQAVVISLPLLMSFSLDKSKIFYWRLLAFAFAAAIVLMGLSTGSRALLICFLAILILFLLLYSAKYSFRNMVGILLSVATVVTIVIIVLSVYNSSQFVFISNLFERLSEGDTRSDLWLFYLKKLLVQPWGYGINFEAIVDSLSIGVGRLPPHNFLITHVIQAGAFGLFLVFYYLIKVSWLFKDGINRGSEDQIDLKALCISWIAYLLFLALSGNLFGDFMNAVIIGLLVGAHCRFKFDSFVPRYKGVVG